jgi:hypothetical protein
LQGIGVYDDRVLPHRAEPCAPEKRLVAGLGESLAAFEGGFHGVVVMTAFNEVELADELN